MADTILRDSTSQSWLLGVTNSGLVTTDPVAGGGVPFVTLIDAFDSTLWDLSVLVTGELATNPGTGSPQDMIRLTAPNGIIYGLRVFNGLLQTILAPAQCPFNLGDADGALADRLYDSDGQFWTQDERTLYIKEALRTWNALTGYWRSDFTFSSVEGTQWYDLTDLTAMPNTLRAQTLISTDLMTIIQYHLLEPPVGDGPWMGSLQFTSPDLRAAIQRRRNEVLGSTGCQISRILMPALSVRTQLNSSVIDIRRISYIPADLTQEPIVMWEDDTWALQSFDGEYTVNPAGEPTVYKVSTEPWLTFDVDTPPLPGQFEILVVSAGGETETTTAPLTDLEVPDDWAWAIKWGALADLFGRESNAKDQLRAKYCEQRYKDALSLLVEAPALLALRINNVPLQIDSLKNLDQYDNNWQSREEDVPDGAAVAGLNLIALKPLPDAGPYSLTATVVQNAPMPTDQTSCLMLDRSLFDVIVDYAQHLAMLKCGGAEFAATSGHLTRFYQAAALYAGKLMAQGPFTQVLYDISQREEETNPRYAAGMGPGA